MFHEEIHKTLGSDVEFEFDAIKLLLQLFLQVYEPFSRHLNIQDFEGIELIPGLIRGYPQSSIIIFTQKLMRWHRVFCAVCT